MGCKSQTLAGTHHSRQRHRTHPSIGGVPAARVTQVSKALPLTTDERSYPLWSSEVMKYPSLKTGMKMVGNNL